MNIRWCKSSFSEDSDGNCLELASHGDSVLMRESDEPAMVVRVSPQLLNALLAGAKAGEFDSRE